MILLRNILICIFWVLEVQFEMGNHIIIIDRLIHKDLSSSASDKICHLFSKMELVNCMRDPIIVNLAMGSLSMEKLLTDCLPFWGLIYFGYIKFLRKSELDCGKQQFFWCLTIFFQTLTQLYRC